MSDKWRECLANGSRFLVIAAGLCLSLATVGCGEFGTGQGEPDTGPTPECQLDRDCPVGDQCEDGECVPIETGCVDELDCEEHETCEMGNCVPRSDTGGADAADTDGGDTSDAGDTSPCTGCYLTTGEGSRSCVVGTHNEACGTGGDECTACDSDEYCAEGTCEEASCTPETCDGCCRNDECQSGDTAEACGIEAETCETCSGEATCEEGECEAPCSERCNGCCDEEGNCLEGDSPDSCGTGGDACEMCSDDEECRGSCVESNCEVSCGGCCVDGECKQGTADEACGRDGDACQTCSESFGCDDRASGGICVLQDESTWDVVAVRGKVPNSRKRVDIVTGEKFDEDWDNTSKPDAKLTVSNDTASKSAETSAAKDSLEPSWKETTITDVKASDLTGSPKTSLKIVDDDFFSNDLIAECDIQFKTEFGEGQFDGNAHEFGCKHTHAGEEISPSVWLRLERH